MNNQLGRGCARGSMKAFGGNKGVLLLDCSKMDHW